MKRLFSIALVWALGFVNRYEGGQRMTGKRSQLPAWVRDARFDADAATRTELVRKSRYFERNNALVNRLADLFEEFTVGATGLEFTPASSGEAWNRAAKAWWQQWCVVCDRAGNAVMGSLQSLAVRSWFIDGEVFILLTSAKAPGQPSQPRIQLIEAHRVATPPALWREEGRSIVDGVEVDPLGKPIAYWVNTGFEEGMQASYERIEAEFVAHLFEPSRPGMYRGLPFLYPVMNDLHDLDDLQVLEMDALKDAAEKSTFIKNAAGELDIAALRIEKVNPVVRVAADGTQSTEERTKAVRNAIGGRTFALQNGEDVSQFLPQRPTGATQAVWDILTSKVCAGVGMSKLLVYPWSVQGTVTRADLDVANVFFRSRSARVQEVFGRVYQFGMGWAVNNVRELARKPADWRAVNTRPPRSVNVDVGRNSQAMLAELKAGTRTYQDIFAEMGQDWRVQLRQKAMEAAYIKALSAELGVWPQEISDQAAAGVTKETEGAQGQPLNGAQITAALDVMGRLREKALTPEAAAELLAQIGIERAKAAAMTNGILALDTGAGDVAFKREVLKQLLSVPAAREAVYNALDIEDLVSATGLPPESGYQAPWIPVIAPAGQPVTGEVVKDPEGDVVGGVAEDPEAEGDGEDDQSQVDDGKGTKDGDEQGNDGKNGGTTA